MAELSVIQDRKDGAVRRAFNAAKSEADTLGDSIYHVMIIVTDGDGGSTVFTSGGCNTFEKLGILQDALDTVKNTPVERVEAEDDV